MLDKKTKLILKLVMGVLALGALGIAITMVIFITGKDALGPMPDFFDKWGICVSLLCMGGIVLILMNTSQSKYAGSESKDQFIMIVLVLLVLCAALSVIFAYMGVFSPSSL